MLLLGNSSNADGIFRELLRRLLGDTDTPWQWEGYMPFQAVGSEHHVGRSLLT